MPYNPFNMKARNIDPVTGAVMVNNYDGRGWHRADGKPYRVKTSKPALKMSLRASQTRLRIRYEKAQAYLAMLYAADEAAKVEKFIALHERRGEIEYRRAMGFPIE